MLSDHTSDVLVMPRICNVKPKPFKFHNYLTAKDDFIPVVRHVWSNKVNGFSMFLLVSKLKMLKKPLRKLNFEQGNLFDNVKRLKAELAAVQSSLTADPHNNSLRVEELRVLKAYRAALKDRMINVLGQSSYVLPFTDPDSLFVKKLPVSEALNLVRNVSNEEIKLAMFDIDGNKAPGPDGFSS
ncbi:hypothetical protein Tco_1089422 [Tanacetum coccineum]